jgi:hypothetical protein
MNMINFQILHIFVTCILFCGNRDVSIKLKDTVGFAMPSESSAGTNPSSEQRYNTTTFKFCTILTSIICVYFEQQQLDRYVAGVEHRHGSRSSSVVEIASNELGK